MDWVPLLRYTKPRSKKKRNPVNDIMPAPQTQRGRPQPPYPVRCIGHSKKLH